LVHNQLNCNNEMEKFQGLLNAERTTVEELKERMGLRSRRLPTPGLDQPTNNCVKLR